MQTLYIYNSNSDKKIDTSCNNFTYNLNNGKIRSNAICIDDSKYLHSIALELRDSYVKRVNSFNKYFLDSNLIYENTISMFFLSDIFNKRTEIFDTYLSICNLTFIQRFLDQNKNISSIITIGCNSNFNTSLKSFILDKKLEIKDEIKSSKKINRLYRSQIKFFFLVTIKLFLIKMLFKQKEIKSSKRLFLSRYPLHFDTNQKEKKYGSYFKYNKDVFMISLITDGLHQNLNIRDTITYLKKIKNSKNFLFLDYHLNYKDLINGFVSAFKLIKKAKNLGKYNYIFNGININDFFQLEIQLSFLRIPRLMIYKNALIKTVNKKSFKKFIFYLHEYSYGQYFNYIFAKYFPSIKRIGFQHGPASERKLLYFLGKEIVSNSNENWRGKSPIPDQIMAEDKSSKIIYESAGYKNVKCMKKIYRLSYLNKIKRKTSERKSILIVPGLHDEMLLFNRLKKIIEDNKNTKFIFKPHPRGIFNHKNQKINLNNLEIGNKHISDYLSYVSEVYCTYSSVGYEAYKLKIPVTLICFQNKINESPLIDFYSESYKKNINIIW